MARPLRKKDPARSVFKSGDGPAALAFFGTLAAAAAAWEGLAHSGLYPAHLFPAPSSVLEALRGMIVSGELGADIRSSGRRWLAGVLLGNAAGISMGLLSGAFPWFRRSVGQLLNVFRTLPFMVLIPLAILWFGLGEMEKILIVAWGALFPAWLNMQAGMTGVEREYVWAARCLGARGARLYMEVHLHRCLPFLLAGVRQSIATATFALAAAEMAGAFEGVAYRIFYSHEMFQTDKMMAGIVVVAVIGFAADRSFVWLSRFLLPWWEGDEA